MLSKDELIKSVAQSCGISVEVSSFFFEVFVNRLSNKLKPGDLLHFQNDGFFHKRNCRIQIEKTADSPTPKSYLIQLVLFSSEMKIKSDLSDVHFLKIPNLKTLWMDDKEFQKSLNAGDFAPHSDRNQLIKSFATKAEVIISSLRKDYDNELIEELIIPLTFDLNFLVKSGKKNSTSNVNSNTRSAQEQKPSTSESKEKLKEAQEPTKPEEIKRNEKTKEATEDGLPWNYGKKFLDKDKSENSVVEVTDVLPGLQNRETMTNTESKLRKEQVSRFKDFEPVVSHSPGTKDDKIASEESRTVKFSVHPTSGDESDKSDGGNKFTEVKSKSESYRKGKRYDTTRSGRFDKYSSIKSSREKAFTDRRNFLPIVAIVAFIVIAIIVVYIYFIKGSENRGTTNAVTIDVRPPQSVKIIDRDFEFVVSYPYPKMEDKIEMSGFNENLFSSADIKPKIKKETKTEVKPEQKNEKITGITEKPKVDIKTEPPVQEKTKPVVEEKKVNISRIFLYKGFYVVFAGSYKSEDAANREADKYFDLGYNAFVEVSENRQGDRFYNLTVGDFTSEEFAKEFQEKYLK